jgi:hypothetical protein
MEEQFTNINLQSEITKGGSRELVMVAEDTKLLVSAPMQSREEDSASIPYVTVRRHV